ncbi:MAG: family peptidase [Ilumatobacteraceae bacterium]|nr:family peptidase [Ilumatobacteraceae bacterium]
MTAVVAVLACSVLGAISGAVHADRAAEVGPTSAAPERARDGAPGPVLPSLALAGPGSSAVIVRFADDADAAAEGRRLAAAGMTVGAVFQSPFVGATVQATPDQLHDLDDDPAVVSVEADQPVQLPQPSAGPISAPVPVSSSASSISSSISSSIEAIEPSAPWGLDRIDQRSLPLSGTYSYAGTGAGVTVYELDSGIRADHVEFDGRVLPGAYLNDGFGPGDCNGHGTHVAGTIGSSTYGVAKGVSLVPVRVVDCSGAGSTSGIILGLRWIIANHQAGIPAVVNMSLGGQADHNLDLAVQAAVNDGIVVVAAAGNDGGDACADSPGRLPAVITVAAVDATDSSPDWSDSGSCVDLFAPGVGVLSTWNSTPTSLRYMSGTSMASPHVAGAAALVLAQQPTLSPAGVAARLAADATPGVVGNARPGTPNLLLYAPSAPPAYVPMVPARLMDTRPGYTTIDGQDAQTGTRGAGTTTELQVAGRAGIPTDATAAVLNITVTEPTAPGFITVAPCGTPTPNSSNVNYTAGTTTANAVIAKIGTNGKVCITTSAPTHTIADINGYFPAG